MTKDYLTVADLADILGVTERTIWRWETAALMPEPLRVGRTVRWEREIIDEWLKGRESAKVYAVAAKVACDQLEDMDMTPEQLAVVSTVRKNINRIEAITR